MADEGFAPQRCLPFTKELNESNVFVSPLSYSQLTKRDLAQRGQLTENHSKLTRYSGKLMLSYNRNFFDKLYTTVTGGTTIESYNGNNTSYESMGYYSPNLSHPAFAAQYPSGKPSGQDISTTTWASS